MPRILAIAVLTLIGISPCSATDPLAKFETIIKRSQASASKEPYIYFVKSSKNWGRMLSTIEGVRYDVRKTDSLVSPFVGVVSFDVPQRFFTYTSEADARGAVRAKEKKEKVFLHLFRLNYAYQANAWRFISGESSGFAFVGDSDLASRVDRNNWKSSHKFTSVAGLEYYGESLQSLLRPWLL